jgi:3-oxoacyl-[acyl-carrier-protein] synthase-3
MSREAYITATGAYLPGEPLDNDEIARRLGSAEVGRGMRARVLAANGIRTRHYALDEHGHTTMLNEELAAAAVQVALKERGLPVERVGMLATGTTQGDLMVPGFASMVHGRLGGAAMELLSAAGVCGAGMAALRAAASAIRLSDHDVAVAVGSELVSRALRRGRYDAAKERVGYNAEFLRWTLSDGAGCVVLESAPRPDGPSLRLDWMHLVSHAHAHRVCMSAGLADGVVRARGVSGSEPRSHEGKVGGLAGLPDGGGPAGLSDGGGPAGRPTGVELAAGATWMDLPDAATAERAGMLLLRQDVAVLPELFGLGLREFAHLVRAGRFDPAGIEHVLCHYSAEHFRGEIFAMLRDAGLMIPEERWFSNLATRGNTGAASIFIALHDAVDSGRFAPGDRVLLIVPESGRFSFAFAHLTCVAPGQPATLVGSAAGSAPPNPAGVVDSVAATRSPLGVPRGDDTEVTRATVLGLTAVWEDFEVRLARVPLVRRIEAGTATGPDYLRLLRHLRQQVVEGGRWIARAASNFSVELFELRSAAIHHAAEEHRDFRMLERDYVAAGGALADIQSGHKNVGSEALSGYLFHQASLPDPIDLLGAMFIIEGLGTAKVAGWARRLRDTLGLTDEQVTFLTYHGQNDDEHFEILRQILRSDHVDRAAGERIIRTATVVARLYVMQLEAVDEEEAMW